MADFPRWPCLARYRAPYLRGGRFPCSGPGALAPKSSAFRGVEVGKSLPFENWRRASEEVGLPFSAEPGAVPPKRSVSLLCRNRAPCLRGGRSPCSCDTRRPRSEEPGFPDTTRRGSRSSEERRVPLPQWAGIHPVARRLTAPRRVPSACPGGSGGLRDRAPCLRRGRSPCPERGGGPGAPRSAWFPVPRRSLAPGSPKGAVR